MKKLFIISLKFPLINTINILLNVLKKCEADIILVDNGTDIKKIATNLSGLKVFNQVFLVNTENIYSFKDFLKGNARFSDIIKNEKLHSERLIWRNVDFNKYISSYIENTCSINMDDYDSVYVRIADKFTLECLDWLNKNKRISEINIIEEGVNSYCNSIQTMVFVNRYPNLKIVLWLYNKELMMFENERMSIRVIPKIKFNDYCLKNILNSIFEFQEAKKNYDNSIVYFEQVSEPMPSYLRNINKFKQLLLSNAYKKHLREHHLYEEKCKVIDLIEDNIKKFPQINFFIKLHPRTIYGMPKKYKMYIFEDNSKTNIPWELYYLNSSFRNSMWLTTASGAVTNALYCFDNSTSLKIGLTYKFDKEYKEYLNKNLDSFYLKLKKSYDNIEIYEKHLDLNEDILRFAERTNN